MFSATVRESNKAPDWKTIVTFLRIRRSSGSAKSVMSSMGDDDAAAVGLEEAHDVRQGDGFADAAAADDGDRLAGIDVKIGID